MNFKFYEWWKKNRMLLTFGGFLVLFGLYLSPIVKVAKYKKTCIKLSEKGALYKFIDDNIKDKLLQEAGLTIEELSKIEGYKNCLK